MIENEWDYWREDDGSQDEEEKEETPKGPNPTSKVTGLKHLQEIKSILGSNQLNKRFKF